MKIESVMKKLKSTIDNLAALLPPDDPKAVREGAEKMRTKARELEKNLSRNEFTREKEKADIYRLFESANQEIVRAERIEEEQARIKKESAAIQARIDHEPNLARAKAALKAARAQAQVTAATHTKIAKVLEGLHSEHDSTQIKFKAASAESSSARVAARLAGKPAPASKETRLGEVLEDLKQDIAAADQQLAGAKQKADEAALDYQAASAAFHHAVRVHQDVLFEAAREDFFPHVAQMMVARELAGIGWDQSMVMLDPPFDILDAERARFTREFES